MEISQAILDDLTAKAKASERLRMNLDLRDSVTDDSQRTWQGTHGRGPWQGTGTWQQSPNASRETQSGVL